MSNRKNPYLFYTEYYIISGAYHIVNVVHDVLTYSASCSDNIKGYLHSKVINKKIILDEIVYNNGVVKTNDADVDEDGFVVIRTRRPKLKNDATVATVTDVTDTYTNSAEIINNMLNEILDNLDNLDILGNLETTRIKNNS